MKTLFVIFLHKRYEDITILAANKLLITFKKNIFFVKYKNIAKI